MAAYKFGRNAAWRTPQYVRALGLASGVRTVIDVITTPAGRTGQIPVPGLDRPVRFRGGTTDRRSFEQVFVSRQYACPSIIGAPKVIVDGGANVGYSAAYFALAYPEARIIAVEAAASNMPLLEENTAGLANVTTVHAALWSQDEPVEIVDPTADTWSYSVRASSALGDHRVEGVTIETLMARFNLEFIDFLKLDIEGAEHALFQASDPWIEKVGSIAVELHERKAPGCSETFERAIAGRVLDRVRRHENEFVRLNSVAADNRFDPRSAPVPHRP